MICFLGSANRDDRRFAAPDKFDTRRTDVDAERAFTSAANHFAFFGGGRHFCLGAMMAKTEVQIGVSRLLDATVGLRFAGEPPADEGLFLRGTAQPALGVHPGAALTGGRHAASLQRPKLMPRPRPCSPVSMSLNTSSSGSAALSGMNISQERNPANPVGQRFLQKLRMGRSVREFNGEIIAWEKPTHFGLHIPTAAYSSEAHFQISPEGPGTLDRRLFHRRNAAHAHGARTRNAVAGSSRISLRQKSDRQAQGLRRKLAGPPGRMLEHAQGRDLLPRRSNCGSCASATAGLIRSSARSPLPDGEVAPSDGGDCGVDPSRQPFRVAPIKRRFGSHRILKSVSPTVLKRLCPPPPGCFPSSKMRDSSNVAIAADNMGPGGTRRIAKAPQVFYPGRWTHETAYDNRLDFDNGDFVRNTLKVVSKEWVETERGAFLAWKSEIDSESVAMLSSSASRSVDWWTPELGAPVRFSTDARTPDGLPVHALRGDSPREQCPACLVRRSHAAVQPLSSIPLVRSIL